MESKILKLKWSISKARETEGYNICTLLDGNKRYSCNGGGYDMQGTALALWLEANFQDRLSRLLENGFTNLGYSK